MMTLRKTWYVRNKAFTFVDEVDKINQIGKDLYDYETQYLTGYICYDTYIDRIRRYLVATHVEYAETETEES